MLHLSFSLQITAGHLLVQYFLNLSNWAIKKKVLTKALKNVHFVQNELPFRLHIAANCVWALKSWRTCRMWTLRNCALILLWQRQMDFLHIMTGRSILKKNSRKLQTLQRGECYLLAVVLTLTHLYSVYADEGHSISRETARNSRERMELRWKAFWNNLIMVLFPLSYLISKFSTAHRRREKANRACVCASSYLD